MVLILWRKPYGFDFMEKTIFYGKTLIIWSTFKLMCTEMFKYSSCKHALVIYTPCKPHFYMIKLCLEGYIFFLIFALKHRLWLLI